MGHFFSLLATFFFERENQLWLRCCASCGITVHPTLLATTSRCNHGNPKSSRQRATTKLQFALSWRLPQLFVLAPAPRVARWSRFVDAFVSFHFHLFFLKTNRASKPWNAWLHFHPCWNAADMPNKKNRQTCDTPKRDSRVCLLDAGSSINKSHTHTQLAQRNTMRHGPKLASLCTGTLFCRYFISGWGTARFWKQACITCVQRFSTTWHNRGWRKCSGKHQTRQFNRSFQPDSMSFRGFV